MKKYVVPGGAYGHQPEHPERTARRQIGRFPDINTQFQEWPNRKSMARSIRMQEMRGYQVGDWSACVRLGECEGY